METYSSTFNSKSTQISEKEGLRRFPYMFSRICVYFSGVALLYILLFYHVIIPAGVYGHQYLRDNYFKEKSLSEESITPAVNVE